MVGIPTPLCGPPGAEHWAGIWVTYGAPSRSQCRRVLRFFYESSARMLLFWSKTVSYPYKEPCRTCRLYSLQCHRESPSPSEPGDCAWCERFGEKCCADGDVTFERALATVEEFLRWEARMMDEVEHDIKNKLMEEHCLMSRHAETGHPGI